MASPDELARICKVLSVPARVRIVQLLKGEKLCVGGLARRLGVTQGAVSQHLRVMRDTRLLTADRRGYYVHYRINEETSRQWQQALDGLLTPAGRGRT